MNLTLKRTSYTLYGIMGSLIDEAGNTICVTLEHAYPDGKGGYTPKLAPGSYQCQRGMHELRHGVPFQTFEVLGVPPFQGATVTGLLCCHVGNYNNDSEGCVLAGTSLGQGCILESGLAFTKFMELQTGVDQYQLTVS